MLLDGDARDPRSVPLVLFAITFLAALGSAAVADEVKLLIYVSAVKEPLDKGP